MAAQSLLPSFSPQTLLPVKPRTLTLVFSSLSSSKPPSISLSYLSSRSLLLLRNDRSISSSIARKVAVSSEVQEEETEGEEGAERGSFSPDLKLFVGNLPFSVDSAELAGLFERAGTVELVEVIYDKLTGRSRGFGFVTMSTVEEVEAAAQQFNGYELMGRILRVNSGPPPPKDELPSRGFRTGGSMNATNRVYVGNLSWGVDNLALETLFSEQGKVMEAKVVYDRESGRSRGFGFVTYSSAEEVNNAISSLDGTSRRGDVRHIQGQVQWMMYRSTSQFRNAEMHKDLDGRTIRVTVAEERPRRQF